MDKKSLYLARKRIIERISTMDAPLQDRVELMINLCKFLDDNEYEENIKVLRLNEVKKGIDNNAI